LQEDLCSMLFLNSLLFITLDYINPLKAELNPICHLLSLLGANHIFHVSVLRVRGFFFLIKICKSVHHRTIQIDHQPDATIFQFIILTFI